MKTIILCFFIFCILHTSVNAEEFIYDSHGKKDPFSAPIINTSRDVKEELLANVQLEAIIWDDESPLTMINDKVVGIGDEIAGAKIVEIKQNEVIFEADGKQVILKLRLREEGGI